MRRFVNAKFLFIIVICSVLGAPLSAFALDSNLEINNNEIRDFVVEEMKAGKIPGLSLVIVKGTQTIYQEGFGQSDLEKGSTVTGDTLFELGSNSKAFTGLAILQLEEQGKLDLDDPVDKYLPWFYTMYKGERRIPTLRQFIYHTSGIPAETLGLIPASNEPDALEQLIREFSGTELRHRKGALPGEFYEYATINYDILGLVIQQVSGKTYEQYMKENIFTPLGLNNTYVIHEDAVQNGLSLGYKIGYLKPRQYDAPIFKGNVPAGYIYSSSNDIARWLKFQLGALSSDSISSDLIHKSHMPDRSVPPGGDLSSYAVGWSVFQWGTEEISHAGENPTFSSFFLLKPEDEIAIGVMANLSTNRTEYIARSINDLMLGRQLVSYQSDGKDGMDKLAVIWAVVMAAMAFTLVGLLLKGVWDCITGKRKFIGIRPRLIFSFLFSLAGFVIFIRALHSLPILLFEKLPWKSVQVWGPSSIYTAYILTICFGCLFLLHYWMTLLFPKQGEKLYLSLFVIGAFSGFGNAFIIFVVNKTFGEEYALTSGLLFYFLVGLALYVLGQRYLSARIVTLANDMVYGKRVSLMGKILRTPYHKLEKLEDGHLQTVLIQDTEVVARSMNVIVSGVINLVTLLCCLLYLGMLNVYALFLSLAVIVIAAGLYYVLGNRAEQMWEQTRDIQTLFFRLANDMFKGFKDLRINHLKKMDFEKQLDESCDKYRIMRTIGDKRFATVNVIGELLFTLVIGVVAFLFPYVLIQLSNTTIQTYVFIFLYMTGPVNALLISYPTLVQIKIAWKRVQDLDKNIAELQQNEEEATELHIPHGSEQVELVLQNVTYSYQDVDGSQFAIGPLELKVQSGTITFITGGNGSGKTTLAKLITGLYIPKSGSIRLNGNAVEPNQLSQYYSVVFNDSYLFDRLYGIQTKGREQEIDDLIMKMNLQDKVTVKEGRFSTTDLSTGQKKRLALLVCYLEDRPIFLLDEWAAEQDPEFRRYFYEVILTELKKAGKCIVAITHDDRYFHVADQRIKLDLGRIISDPIETTEMAHA